MPASEGVDRVTLAQVASEAGVSLSTVSKVLNGRTDVSPGTRQRVEELLTTHGYRRRAPAPPEAPLIEIVFHELESAWAMELIRGVENVAREAKAGLVLTESGTRHSPGAEWIDGVLRRRPLGVVLVFSNVPEQYQTQLRSRGIPYVVIDPAGDPAPDVPSVGSANWSGGVAATQHLIDRGHRRIGVITGPGDMMCSVARLAGYRSAMAMASLPVDPDLIRYGDFHVEGGCENALKLLAQEDPPTAIFAGSDLQALGVFEAARSTGLHVPDDLSVVGYDDLPIARWSSPALTTVHQPLKEMAEEATRLVLRLRAGEATPTRMDLGVDLVVRQSTAPPRR
ncbi:MAG TPA: LacI family DNA-binding transcriptional regulator [Actinomycetales bacterium]|nr:LacI family DNA-binding transcriptional regulator [Actinomycetales bacterium]